MKRWADALICTGADREKEDMVWNMIGSICYAFASMALSFLVMRIAGEEQGGIFAFGFSTVGQQMFLLAYFGIRPFQITDGKREFSFGDYLHHRYLTSVMAMAAGFFYLVFSQYSRGKMTVIFLLVAYKVIDGFADVYESEFQRNGRLYLTGKSNTFRTLLSVGIFLLVLTAGENLTAACTAAVGAQIAGVFLFDIVVLRQLSGVDYRWRRESLRTLTAATALLFVSVFLDFYVFSAAKYAVDAHVGDAASGYFNVIFMPTSIINLAAGFVIRPFLTQLTACWNGQRFEDFSSRLLQLTSVIGIFAMMALGGAVLLGHPVLRILEMLLGSAYAGKLASYYKDFVLIVLGGGFYAVLNLYYYALVIMRRQKTIFGIYLVMAVVAAVLARRLVVWRGIPGAARAYLYLMILMALGFVSLAWHGYGQEKRAKEAGGIT